jgi:hypothetical protein
MKRSIALLLLSLPASCAGGLMLIPAGPGLCPVGLDGCGPEVLGGLIVVVAGEDAEPSDAGDPGAGGAWVRGGVTVPAPAPSVLVLGSGGAGGGAGGVAGDGGSGGAGGAP